MCLIFSTASKIHLVGELILHLMAGHPRSPYIWSFMACGGPIYLVPDVIAGHHRWPLPSRPCTPMNPPKSFVIFSAQIPYADLIAGHPRSPQISDSDTPVTAGH